MAEQINVENQEQVNTENQEQVNGQQQEGNLGQRDTASNSSGETSGLDNQAQENKALNFDEFLKDPKNQSIFDKRVAKAIDTARTKWEKEASMTAEEIAEEKANERLRELEEREAAQDRREFIADIKEDLMQNNLPLAFGDLIADGTDRDNYKEVLKELKTEWDKQINEQIKASVRQKEPRTSEISETSQENIDIAQFAKQNRKVK